MLAALQAAYDDWLSSDRDLIALAHALNTAAARASRKPAAAVPTDRSAPAPA